MVEVTYAELHGWITAFFWPFARISALMLTAPLWGHSAVPRQVKIMAAAALAILVAPMLSDLPQTPIFSWAGFGILVEQMFVGAAIGLTARIIVSIVQASGEFIGLQMGLAFATFFDPGSGTNMAVLSRILYMITLLLFLAFNGHLIVLELLIISFDSLPVGMGRFNPDAFMMLARYGGTIFSAGMLMALPLVIPLLTINLGLGIINRAAPQLTVFNIGFPTSLTVGLALLMVLMTDMSSYLQRHFASGLGFLQGFMDTLAPLPPPM